MKLIDKDALVAEIERLISNGKIKCQQSQENDDQVCYIAWSENIAAYRKILSFLNTLEVKEADNMPNIRFPHYKSIVEKVFGASNLESFEYEEAEQLVSLAKEELLKDLEVKEVDYEKEYRKFLKGFNGNSVPEAAKHFFELGLKAQKG